MIAFGIFAAMIFVLMLAILELNKNTLIGFALLIALTVGFVVLFIKVLHG